MTAVLTNAANDLGRACRTSIYDRVMSAVDAALAVAEAHGVRSEKPVVLCEAWHVLVHLWPSPVVARVTSGAPGIDPADVERELAVARHAARAGAPVVQPSDVLPPGPHHHDGHTLVFWRYLVQAGELDATAAGRGLRTIHDSLADYDGELPRAGRVEEVRAMLRPFAPSDDVELLCDLASRELPEGQALHGDAHLFNCIQTPAGPIWHDLETACRGPREYDLAALVLDDRSRDSDPEARIAVAAYGDYDEELLEQALPVYAAWVAASFMVAVARRPDAAPSLERQLRFLRRFRH
jgi:Phosphotransferase enzyme family